MHWPISRRKGEVAIFCIDESNNFELHPRASNRELHSQAMHPFAKSLWTFEQISGLPKREEWRRDEIEQLLYLEESSEPVKVTELLNRKSTRFHRCRSSLPSDGFDSLCSLVRQSDIQRPQTASNRSSSVQCGETWMNFDLVASTRSTMTAARLQLAVVFRFGAVSENCKGQNAG